MSFVPKVTGPTASAKLLWRLKHNVQADEDFVIVHTVRPYVTEEFAESDNEDLDGGFRKVETGPLLVNQDHEDAVDGLRKIMAVAQDQCHMLLDKIDAIA